MNTNENKNIEKQATPNKPPVDESKQNFDKKTSDSDMATYVSTDEKLRKDSSQEKRT